MAKSKIKDKQMMWGKVLLIFVVGILVGVLFERSRVNGRIEATVAVVQNQLDEAKRKMWQHGLVDDSMMKNAQDIMMMTQSDSTSMKVILNGVNGNKTTGKALVLRKNNMLYVSANAKLSDPTNGAFYEGWLVKSGSNPLQTVALGRLMKLDDGSWGVAYSSSNLYDGYNQVVVTLERTDDQKPETHVLEGTAK